MSYEWDISNDQDRLILETARTWGVSPSTFMGDPQTVHMLSISGNVLGHNVIASPWTAEDRKAALELAVYEAELCPGCNQPMSETTDPENEFQYRAELPIRCHRCTASGVAMAVYEDAPQAQALFIPVHLKPKGDADVSDRSEVIGSSEA